MTDWNYADVWEIVADAQPDEVAITQGSRNLSWQEFDHGADGVAQFLLDLGVEHQDKVAVYLYNSPEYIQATFAAMKVGMVPVNTNYRYGNDELSYLWENADAVAVVFHGTFADRIEGILERVPGIKGWLWVDDGTGPCPDWATPYDDAVKLAIGRTWAPWGRSGDDLYMLYTGGTTGMPKGVMWRQDDLFARLIDGGVRHYDVNGGLDAVRTALESGPTGVTLMPACPLMHGTGGFTANTTLAEGGRVCLLESRKYDPVEMLDVIQREKVNGLVIVGDPFSRPLLAVLDENPGAWDLSSLVMIISSGAMWSEPVKERLLAAPSRHDPGRRVQLVGGPRHGHVRLGRRGGGQDGVVHPRARRQGPDRGRPGGGSRLRGGRRARTRRPQPARLLQGRGKVGSHLQGDRWRALLDPGRLRAGRCRRHHPPPRAEGRSASTRGVRRSSPRRWKRR